MDKMQSNQHTLREETLTHNTLNCMVCLKKHPINKISVIMHRIMSWIRHHPCQNRVDHEHDAKHVKARCSDW